MVSIPERFDVWLGTNPCRINLPEQRSARHASPGSGDESIRSDGHVLGAVRKIADKQLLELTLDEIAAFDERLLKRAQVYRTLLKMFFSREPTDGRGRDVPSPEPTGIAPTAAR